MADIFQTIFSNGFSWNENVWISNTIWLNFVPKGPIDNDTTLVQIKAWHRIGDKPLSEPKMAYIGDAYMRHSASMSWDEMASGGDAPSQGK